MAKTCRNMVIVMVWIIWRISGTMARRFIECARTLQNWCLLLWSLMRCHLQSSCGNILNLGSHIRWICMISEIVIFSSGVHFYTDAMTLPCCLQWLHEVAIGLFQFTRWRCSWTTLQVDAYCKRNEKAALYKRRTWLQRQSSWPLYSHVFFFWKATWLDYRLIPQAYMQG